MSRDSQVDHGRGWAASFDAGVVALATEELLLEADPSEDSPTRTLVLVAGFTVLLVRALAEG